MDLKSSNVLFIVKTMGIGGTERVTLQLCKIIKPIVNKVVVCSSGGVNEKVLVEIGIKHYTIPDMDDKSIHSMLKTLQTISMILRTERINIIHTHHRFAAFYTSVIKLRHKFLMINTSHNTFTDKKWLTRFAYRNANLISCGEMVKKNLVDVYGFSENRVTVIHNAMEPFEGGIIPIKELAELRQQGYTLVGNVGRLSEQKGMEYFLRSFSLVKQECDTVKYVIVGDGEYREKLKQLVKDLKIENDILFFGYRTDVRNIMSQLDFVVLSSLWEGLPLTPIEAFSVEKTVVATAVDGTPEIVKDGINGILVKPKDVDGLAKGIIKLCKDVSLRRHMENNALKTFDSEFVFETLSKQYIQYYMRLMEKSALLNTSRK